MIDRPPVDRPLILLLGAGGQIGWELARLLPRLATVVAPPRGDVDLEDPTRLRDALRDIRPDCVVNAAAYTDVERAESETERAFAVNATAPGVLAEETARLGGLLVHYSTDYVFDGRASEPYAEEAPTGPLGAYGESKRAGEVAVLSAGGPAIILRTSWVYGLRRSNFLLTMLRLARDPGRVIQVVDDQIGAPTHSTQIAEATVAILEQLGSEGTFGPDPGLTGIFHLSAAGSTTWFGFAREALALDPLGSEHRFESLVPVSTADRPTGAERPRYSVLDNGRLERSFGVSLPHWTDQLRSVLGDPPAGEPALSTDRSVRATALPRRR